MKGVEYEIEVGLLAKFNGCAIRDSANLHVVNMERGVGAHSWHQKGAHTQN